LVLVGIDGLFEPQPELLETIFVQPALKDTFLDPHPVIKADFGHTSESAGTRNIVGYDAQHFISTRRVKVGPGGQQVVPPVGFVVCGQLTRKGT
jgi:hypothetical protein